MKLLEVIFHDQVERPLDDSTEMVGSLQSTDSKRERTYVAELTFDHELQMVRANGFGYARERVRRMRFAGAVALSDGGHQAASLPLPPAVAVTTPPPPPPPPRSRSHAAKKG